MININKKTLIFSMAALSLTGCFKKKNKEEVKETIIEKVQEISENDFNKKD